MKSFEFKGTKGIWHSAALPGERMASVYVEGGNYNEDSVCGVWWNQLDTSELTDSRKADAKLIATSPEMFDFINDIYDGLCDKSLEDGKENDEKLSIWERSVKTRAKELLTKATE